MSSKELKLREKFWAQKESFGNCEHGSLRTRVRAKREKKRKMGTEPWAEKSPPSPPQQTKTRRNRSMKETRKSSEIEKKNNYPVLVGCCHYFCPL